MSTKIWMVVFALVTAAASGRKLMSDPFNFLPPGVPRFGSGIGATGEGQARLGIGGSAATGGLGMGSSPATVAAGIGGAASAGLGIGMGMGSSPATVAAGIGGAASAGLGMGMGMGGFGGGGLMDGGQRGQP